MSRKQIRMVMIGAVLAAAPSRAAADAGETLASYRLTSFDGAATTLSAYRGQVVVVNFWASWCAPCREELATMNRWNDAWAGRGARVVAISIDKDAAKARRFAQQLKLSLTVLHDGPTGLARALDIPSLPCTYLLDPQGRVVSVVRGSSAGELAALRAKVEAMVASTRPVPPQEAGMGSTTIPVANDDGGPR
jgi:peroxiredoxin